LHACRSTLEDPQLLMELFRKFEKDAEQLLKEGLLYPGYDFVIKLSHIFNLLDARGAISPSERQAYILRIRNLARLAAKVYLEAENE
jgi:glycyl-tRNA synthetase alpha chain (EC 6.1.1.14)